MGLLAAGNIPEVPNFLTLLNDWFEDSPAINLLNHYDAVVFSVIIASLLSLFFYFGTKKHTLIPGKFQNFLELIIESLHQLLLGIVGEDGRKYIPFLGTLFIYILSMNLFGMIPLMKSPSANLNITIALSLCVFALVQYLNIKNMGFFGFMHHLAGSPKDFLGWALSPLMFPIELITQISRPITLSLRLFGNILGEKILVGVFVLFGIALLSPFHIPAGLPLQLPFMFLGLLTSMMQALVFTLLSAVYILLSVPHHDEEESYIEE